MSIDSDPSRKYDAVIALLAQAAEHDNAKDLAIVLESVASAISLGGVRELAALCVRFWSDQAAAGVRQALVARGESRSVSRPVSHPAPRPQLRPRGLARAM
jgi:hypothetical protein